MRVHLVLGAPCDVPAVPALPSLEKGESGMELCDAPCAHGLGWSWVLAEGTVSVEQGLAPDLFSPQS